MGRIVFADHETDVVMGKLKTLTRVAYNNFMETLTNGDAELWAEARQQEENTQQLIERINSKQKGRG